LELLNAIRSHPYPATQNGLLSTVAVLTTLMFVAGIALLGTSGASGYFYAASMVIGVPVLIALRPWETSVPVPIRIYAALYFTFLLLCAAHVLLWGASTSVFDYSGRFLLGLINGFFFYHLLGRRRENLFAFLALLAGAQAAVAISYTIYHGFDFQALLPTGKRIGGTTNPIPFSLLFITSLGLLVLALADRLRPDRKYAGLALIGLALGAGLLAAVIGLNRSTTIILPWLFVLLAAAIWLRLGRQWGIGVLVAGLAAGLPVAWIVFQRDPTLWLMIDDALRGNLDFESYEHSSGMRAEMLAIAWKLIPEAPWFGHGLRPFSEILAATGIAEDTSVARFAHVHNEYFNNLLKMGIVGTVLFYAPMILALALAGRTLKSPGQRLYAMAILWVVGAHLIFGLTGVFFEHASNVLQFAVYLGMLIWLVSGEDERAQPAGAR
jgi:O-antigen ligase